MSNNFKPEGYNSVSPYFIVKDAGRFITLIQNIFDAEATRRFDNPDGSIMHAEMKIDDSVIMLSEATARYPQQPIIMHVYVPDVDATFKKAIELGCELIDEPKTSGDLDKRGTFKDFAGNMWSVSTQQ